MVLAQIPDAAPGRLKATVELDAVETRAAIELLQEVASQFLAFQQQGQPGAPGLPFYNLAAQIQGLSLNGGGAFAAAPAGAQYPRSPAASTAIAAAEAVLASLPSSTRQTPATSLQQPPQLPTSRQLASSSGGPTPSPATAPVMPPTPATRPYSNGNMPHLRASSGTVTAPAPAAFTAPGSATALPMQTSGATTASYGTPAASLAVGRAVTGPSPAAEPFSQPVVRPASAVSQPTLSQPAPTAPAAPMRAPAPAMSTPQQSRPQPAAPSPPAAQPQMTYGQQQMMAERQAPAISGTGRAPAPAPEVLPQWSEVWATDPLDHNKDTVSALAFCPAIDGLSGMGGTAGWLISSSKQVLNLWAANAGGRRGGDASLLLAHSQTTDLNSTCLAAETATATLYAISLSTNTIGAQTECVSVHGLHADSLLAYKFRINPVEAPAAAPPGQQRASRQLSKVASLHSLGRAFRNHFVVAAGNKVLLYELPEGGARAPLTSVLGLKPKLEWAATDGAGITTLHPHSLSGGLLFTGAADGTVSAWNMSSRPGTLVRSLKCEKYVTCVQLVDDIKLATSSADGKVCLWDMRRTSSPTATANLDGSVALCLEASPLNDCLAVATTRGLYAVDLLDGQAAFTTIARPVRPVMCLGWNWSTTELYAGQAGGAIGVYRQK